MFIGGALIRRLLSHTSVTIFNLDKIGYASDLTGINRFLKSKNINNRYHLIKEDLCNRNKLDELIPAIDPDIAERAAVLANLKKQIALAKVNAQRAATIKAQDKIKEVKE